MKEKTFVLNRVIVLEIQYFMKIAVFSPLTSAEKFRKFKKRTMLPTNSPTFLFHELVYMVFTYEHFLISQGKISVGGGDTFFVLLQL